jgi:hypothetical protein
MGEFVAASAFQTDRVDQVQEAVEGFFAEHQWPAHRTGLGTAASDDVLIFAPVNGWTVVLWPTYFSDVPAAEFVSRALGVLASSAHIYDGDYWGHTLLRGGQVVDRFASMPDYFTDDAEEVAALARTWAGNPVAVAEAIGCSVADVAPYLVPIVIDSGEDDDDLDEEPAGFGKALPDDEFDLDNPWVFVDFWRRLGITYPADMTGFANRIRLAANWLGKLPGGADL